MLTPGPSHMGSSSLEPRRPTFCRGPYAFCPVRRRLKPFLLYRLVFGGHPKTVDHLGSHGLADRTYGEWCRRGDLRCERMSLGAHGVAGYQPVAQPDRM